MFISATDIHRAKIEKLFDRKPVLRLSDLRRALGVRSRTTVFFALKAAGYLTSYSHAGRYYTLGRIPKFDEHGLWFSGEIRFSKHGTLRATVIVLVREAPGGMTHEELKEILGLKSHDTLRSLVEECLLGREKIQSVYVYLDRDPKRQAAQTAERRKKMASVKEVEASTAPALKEPLIIEVLLAVIHAPRDHARAIAARLRAEGSAASEKEVEAVLARYGLEKKTASSRSRPSQR